MTISIKDVARKAKVSTATVSRVINDSPLVQPDTRDRVLKIIKKFDYHPNLSARSLIVGKHHLLALIVPREQDFFAAFYFRQILYGISEALTKHRYRLMIYQPEGYDPEAGYSPNLEGFQMDGLFMVAPLVGDKLVKFLEEKRKPVVLINAVSKTLDWVDVDNVVSARNVVAKLIELGHRRIGYVGGMIHGHNTAARLQGYSEALNQAQISYDQSLIVYGNYTVDSGLEQGKKLLNLPEPPTAIFAGNDLMAIGVVQAAKEKGLEVPKDISVFGFDDADVASLTHPPLSTVKQLFYEMGKLAAETLVDRVEHPKLPQKTIEVPGKIVMRDSCAPPSNHMHSTSSK